MWRMLEKSLAISSRSRKWSGRGASWDARNWDLDRSFSCQPFANNKTRPHPLSGTNCQVTPQQHLSFKLTRWQANRSSLQTLCFNDSHSSKAKRRNQVSGIGRTINWWKTAATCLQVSLLLKSPKQSISRPIYHSFLGRIAMLAASLFGFQATAQCLTGIKW